MNTQQFKTPEARNLALDLRILAYTAPRCYEDLVALCDNPSHEPPPERKELLEEENLIGSDGQPPRSVRFIVEETVRPPNP